MFRRDFVRGVFGWACGLFGTAGVAGVAVATDGISRGKDGYRHIDLCVGCHNGEAWHETESRIRELLVLGARAKGLKQFTFGLKAEKGMFMWFRSKDSLFPDNKRIG